jgi:hypothetical protein
MKEAVMSPTTKIPDIMEKSPAVPEALATTRRDLFLQGSMWLSAAAIATPFATACARAAEKESTINQQVDKSSAKSLYDRLGGIFAIAGVVNYFSDEII